MNGFDYILYIFDRIYWIFFSLFPEETKNNQSPVVRLVIPILSDFPTAITVSRVGINPTPTCSVKLRL
jgi:hypothetical protein